VDMGIGTELERGQLGSSGGGLTCWRINAFRVLGVRPSEEDGGCRNCEDGLEFGGGSLFSALCQVEMVSFGEAGRFSSWSFPDSEICPAPMSSAPDGGVKLCSEREYEEMGVVGDSSLPL